MTEFFLKSILAEELFGSRICESVEDHEIVEYLYEALLLEKFLYGEPITVPELRKILRDKIINFEFIKLDGEVRPARGTTMMKYIPQPDHPKGIRPSSPKVATFYDLDKMAWRSVSQRSKEIVLKKDEEKGRPIVVVQDVDKKAKKKPEIKKPIERPEEEPIDDLNVGDIRNYLNRNGENIEIEIVRIADDGGIYAKELEYGALFKIPDSRVRNIGEKISEEPGEEKSTPPKKKEPEIEPHKEEPIPGPKIERRPLTKPPVIPGKEKKKKKEEKPILLLPIEQKPSKEAPKEIQEEPGAEELEM
jgi:hypothetical protein